MKIDCAPYSLLGRLQEALNISYPNWLCFFSLVSRALKSLRFYPVCKLAGEAAAVLARWQKTRDLWVRDKGFIYCLWNSKELKLHVLASPPCPQSPVECGGVAQLNRVQIAGLCHSLGIRSPVFKRRYEWTYRKMFQRKTFLLFLSLKKICCLLQRETLSLSSQSVCCKIILGKIIQTKAVTRPVGAQRIAPQHWLSLSDLAEGFCYCAYLN